MASKRKNLPAAAGGCATPQGLASINPTTSDARRQLISARTKAAMARPEVRRRISERTKLGMAARATWGPELAALRCAWAGARPAARKRFLDEILEALYDDAR